MAIEGDRGARELIRAHPADVLAVEFDTPACFSDVDIEASDGFKCINEALSITNVTRKASWLILHWHWH